MYSWRDVYEVFLSITKVADSKREEFRKYLEKAGVLDALTKGLLVQRL